MLRRVAHVPRKLGTEVSNRTDDYWTAASPPPVSSSPLPLSPSDLPPCNPSTVKTESCARTTKRTPPHIRAALVARSMSPKKQLSVSSSFRQPSAS
eukprot:742995-Prorocentrum_minimum.AAC.1